MVLIAFFCMWVVAYILYHRLESRVAETAVLAAFLCLGGMVGSYVFGATWESVKIRKP